MSMQQFSDASPGTGCPICGGPASLPVLVKYGYTIARCTACDTLHVSPIPSDEVLQAFYQDPGYFSGQEEQGYCNYADMKKALLPHFKRRLRVINNCLPSRGRLLDFGCAAGYFLEIARSDGWQVTGVELSREMAQKTSQALHVPVATSLDALPEKDYDAITLWEVIEHLPRPVAELRRLYERLRPGGLLMLSTPNAGHWQAVREPGSWTGYRPPAHLIFFTLHTLEEALRRAGFERIAIRRVSPLPLLPGWLRRLSAPLQRRLTTGQAKVWPLALFTWRAIRVFGWGWQLIARPDDDIFTTLEAVAFRPP
jgi:SAM-dependent methyltransferase